MRIQFAASLLFSLALTGGALLFGHTASAATSRGIDVTLKESEAPGAAISGTVRLYEESYALVIGIDDYTGGWPRLSNAVRDARLVAEALRAHGFHVDFRKNLRSTEFTRALKDFFAIRGENPEARLFLWYAGHGHSEGGEGFLVPADAPKPSARGRFKLSAVHMRDFDGLVRLAESRHVFAVFDACFAATIFKSGRGTPPPAITRKTTLPVRQFLTSGDADQEVPDDGRFRKLFLRAINGETDRADANGDGYLTASELGLYIEDRITDLTSGRLTPRYGKLLDEDYDSGDFVFALPRAAGDTEESDAPNRNSMELSLWEGAKELNSVEAYDDYLKRFPDGLFTGQARLYLVAQRIVTARPSESALSEPAVSSESEAAQKFDLTSAVPVVRVDEIKTAAEQGDADAQALLGQFYSLSGRYRAELDDQGFPALVGRFYISNENYLAAPGQEHVEAAKWYRMAAAQDHAEAQLNLGLIYNFGQGVAQNRAVAARWFLKAAENGNSESQYNLGVMYRDGLGVAQDFSEALKWHLLAAEQGFAMAQYNLGYMYLYGPGVRQDYAEAARWFRLAAEQGEPLSQYNLALLLSDGKGVEQNHVEAGRWYRMAAEQNHDLSQFSLGVIYKIGQGVAQDHVEAVKWYRKAAEQGFDVAQEHLGVMYAYGLGVPQNHAEAVKWYRLAADQGYAKAQFNLGLKYTTGLGVAQNFAEAAKWYREAAVQGFAVSQLALGLNYLIGEGIRKDESEGASWIRKAAEQDQADAQYLLGTLYFNAMGVAHEPIQAMLWSILAANQGHQQAIDNRDAWAGTLTREQVAEAEALAHKWRPNKSEPISDPLEEATTSTLLRNCPECSEAASAQTGDFEAGIEAFNRGDFEAALAEFRPLAAQGDPHSQMLLGQAYEFGQGTQPDPNKAAEWYRKAAQQDHDLAQTNLGRLLMNGKGIPKNYVEAEKWLRKAAEKGFAQAQWMLGSIYDQGLGVARDPKKARKWYLKAADQGEQNAQLGLGFILHFGEGIPQDTEQAISWWSKAAVQGGEVAQLAQLNIGEVLFNGDGVRQDYDAAVKWFRMAAEQGSAEGQYFLGVANYKGVGVPQNNAKSFGWLFVAAINGHDVASNSITEMEKQMTSTQFEQLEDFARQCIASGYRDC